MKETDTPELFMKVALEYYQKINGTDGNKLIFYAFFMLAFAAVRLLQQFVIIYDQKK